MRYLRANLACGERRGHFRLDFDRLFLLDYEGHRPAGDGAQRADVLGQWDAYRQQGFSRSLALSNWQCSPSGWARKAGEGRSIDDRHVEHDPKANAWA